MSRRACSCSRGKVFTVSRADCRTGPHAVQVTGGCAESREGPKQASVPNAAQAAP